MRAYSSATHATGTATASGTPSRSSRRSSASEASQKTGVITASPSHDRYIIGCATRTHCMASAKKVTPPR